MSDQIETGTVERINQKTGKLRYEVRLDGGELVLINQRLIVPEPLAPLATGTRLAVERKGNTVIGAQLQERRDTQTESHMLTVSDADPARGLITVAWIDGKPLRLYLPPGQAGWRHLRPGAQVEVTRTSHGHDDARYACRPVPAPAAPKGTPRRTLREDKARRSAEAGDGKEGAVRQNQELDAISEHVAPRAQPQSEAETPSDGRPDRSQQAPALPPWDEPPWEPGLVLRPSPPQAEPARRESAADLERPVLCPPVAGLFEPGGPVAGLLGPRYRPRPGQIQMASSVREALQGRKHALIEAGTGIGKSFAYLMPIIWARAQAVVSTSNKALMNQLWEKDLPALQRIAPHPLNLALLKGRSNYVCALKLTALNRQRRLPGLAKEQDALDRGLERVPAGDVELMRLSFELAARVTVREHECEGSHCAQYSACYFERAKAKAAQADIIVTNHALLCYSMLHCDNNLVPVRPVLVIDEAHELERYATGALTQTLEHGTLPSVVNHTLTREAIPEDVRRQAMEFNQAFFEAVGRQRAAISARKWALQGEIQEGLRLWKVLNDMHGRLAKHKVEERAQGQLDALMQFADEGMTAVSSLSQPEGDAMIRYCELSDDSPSQGAEALLIHYQPLEIAGSLREALYDVWPRVICTSATLGVSDDLGWLGRRLGAPVDGPILAETIHSPFNYREHVLVYTPRGITPAYGEGEAPYVAKLAEEVRRLVEASRGRAFVLCTSRRRMDQLFDRLKPVLPYPCLCQGRGLSRGQLLESFQDGPGAVLFGTRSFWEGVDIPGETLSMVILDKIPFVPQDDPVLARQEKRVEARGGVPFQELQLGQAILTLRQGAGRLVRSETDRGVIALLDSRVLTSRYGQQIMRALPDGRQVLEYAEVQRFFAE